MFTDIKGFTTRAANSTREELATLLKRHEEIVLPRAQGRGGVLIKTIGDAYLFTFESPTNAVLAGIEIQAAMAEHNAQCPPQERIELRMGINAGDVTVIDGDVFGDAVNVASRIESLAEPGEVYFSEAVFLIVNRAELKGAMTQANMRISEVGYRELKGVAERIRIYRVHSKQRRTGAHTLELEESGERIDLGLTSTTEMVLDQNGAPIDLAALAPRIATGEFVVVRGTGPQGVRLQTTGSHRVPESSAPTFLSRMVMVGGILFALGGLVALGMGLALGSWWLMAMGVLAVAAGHPFNLGFIYGRTLLVRSLSLGAMAVLASAFAHVPLAQLEARTQQLVQKADKTGPAAWGALDTAGAYLLYLLRLADWTLEGQREVATNHLHMLRGQGRDVELQSHRPLAAPSVVEHLASFAHRLEQDAKGSKVKMQPQNVTLGERDPLALRHLLAPLRLEAIAERQGGEGKPWRLHVTAQTPVKFTPGKPEPMFSWRDTTLHFHPALGVLLQKGGWLQPYVLTHRWVMDTSDPRLRVLVGKHP